MKIAIVGATGAVGKELQSLLSEYEGELILMDSKSTISFEGVDLAFFCVSSELAKKWIPIARDTGTLCIDSSTAFRSDPEVPLVIPEINAHALKKHNGVIASPNCTTTIMLMPLAPLHKEFQIKRIVASTYQAVSGAGAKAVTELKEQSQAILEGEETDPKVFPYVCAFNVFPHESDMLDSGYVAEEQKMHEESQKILEDSNIAVTATCVRVPVFRVHAVSINVEFMKPITKDAALSLIASMPGVTLKKNTVSIDGASQHSILCDRVRVDHSQANTLEMWVVGDQLLKGAALNMFQIAKTLGCLKETASKGVHV